MPDYLPSATEHLQRTRRFVQWIYPMRVLGVTLLALPVLSVMEELDSPPLFWVAAAFNVLVWPHLAFLLARRSRDPRRTELRSLVIDTAFGGFWIAVVHVSAMPTAAMAAIFAADRVAAGGWRLLSRAALALLLAFLVTWLALGQPFQPQTSARTMLLSIPAIFVYMLALSHVNHRMARRIAEQNRALDRLSRIDPGVDLPNRRFFNLRGGELLAASRRDGTPLSLMLLDIDLFKQINDRFGHAAGDAVLARLAALLRAHAGADGFAARIGGDEFVLLLPLVEEEAGRVARALQRDAAALALPGCDGWQLGISIGVAGLQSAHVDLQAWMAAADHALYLAKAAAGRRDAAADAVLP